MTEDRNASFVELFFDLVFVFGVTQVAASIHGHLDWSTLWRAAILLALLWWAWTQYTWLAGSADFDELRPRIVILLATAGSFIIAASVQGAWGSDGARFATAYFAVMALAAVFLFILNRGTDRMSGAVIYLSQMMAGSILVLIGGFVADDLRPWFWVGAVVVNVVSSIVVERFEFDLAAAHFAERHGLFVIIVLGEALIAIGVNTVGDPGSVAFFVAGTAVLLTVLAMWWSYFDWVFRTGERALKAAVGIARGRIARDAYSLSHYPLVVGVILFAVGTEELLLHPEVALDRATRWAFLGGLILYLGSQSVMIRRFTGSITWERLILIGVLGFGGLSASEMNAATLGALVAVGLAVTLGVETVRHQQQLNQLRQSS